MNIEKIVCKFLIQKDLRDFFFFFRNLFVNKPLWKDKIVLSRISSKSNQYYSSSSLV